jgi:hypothetical protein
MVLAQTQTQKVVSGNFSSTKNNTLLKTFGVSAGDVLDIKMKSLHKTRGVDIIILQHPGNSLVMEFQGATNLNRKIIAPADAIYQVFYGGERVDFEIDITNTTRKPQGAGRGEIVYVRIPDTLHVSGYVNRPIGENYKLVPYKEKVILNQIIQTEPVANRDFITGEDLMNLYIAGDIKDEYREQKLLSVNVSLIVDAPSSYHAISGVVKAGMDAFIPEISPSKFIGGSKGKTNPSNMYEVVKDAQKEKEKWEKTIQTIKLAQELGDSLRPGTNSTADKILETTGFLLDTDGMKKMALNKGLKAAGASKEVLALADKAMNIPSATDFLKDGFDKYAGQIKGRANLLILEPRKFAEDLCTMPEPTKEVWIQSAMNYGKNNQGFWDVPGKQPTAKNGLQIQSWEMDEGADRKFKFVPSTRFPGYYEIHSGLSGYVMENEGGNPEMKKNGTSIVLWQRHGGESQVFRIKHLGNGRIRIFNYAENAIHLMGRKNANGTEIAVWGDHDGDWMDWYLVDPVTKTAFIPQRNNKTVDVWRDVAILNKTGGAINESLEYGKPGEPLRTNFPYKELKFVVREVNYVSDAKLIVEAQYEITDYTEVIKYRKETQPVNTKDFWTAYLVNYDYAIMYRDQMKGHYEVVTEAVYNNPQRITTEQRNPADAQQQIRLERYQVLSGAK